MDLSNETKNIQAIIMLEAIGKPPEHLTEFLQNVTNKIDEEKGVIVKNKKISESVLVKDQKEFYTNFAEIEIEVEEILYLAILMFKYMPAHMEITSPELIALTNNGWNDIFNELTRRLHSYDEITRVLQIEKEILEKKLKELAPEEKVGKDKEEKIDEKKEEIKKEPEERKKEEDIEEESKKSNKQE